MMRSIRIPRKAKPARGANGFQWGVAGLSFERSAKQSLQIINVEKGSIADVAECREGDVLLKVADQDVSNVLPSAVMAMMDLRLRGASRSVSIEIMRQHGVKRNSQTIWLRDVENMSTFKTSPSLDHLVDMDHIMGQIDDNIQVIEDRQSRHRRTWSYPKYTKKKNSWSLSPSMQHSRP